MFKTISKNAAITCVLLVGAVGCTDGPLEIRERYYLVVGNESNTNYYRITVNARTQVSKAEFRQGWYPTDAVDTLFGEVSSEAGAAAMETEEALREGINQSLLALDRQYREALMDFENAANEERIRRILEARRRLFAVPDLAHGRLEGTEIIEYDPSKNLVTRRSGSKLIFVLSADPDSIIQDIAEISEQQKTQVAIQQFSNIINSVTTRSAQRASARRLFQDASDDQLASEIATAIQTIEEQQADQGDTAVAQVEASLETLSTVIRQLGTQQP